MKLIEDFNDIPSLEFLTSSQLVVTIWNLPAIVRGITEALNHPEDNNDKLYERLEEIDTRISNILQSIVETPLLLKNDLEFMVTPIGLQIKAMRAFANFSPYFESSSREFPVEHWTHYGTVDIKKIDKILVEDERRDIHFRFELACHDCFEENINELFLLLSEREKSNYRVILRYKELLSYWTNRLTEKLYAFWIQTLNFDPDVDENEDPFAYSAHQMAFNYSMINGSKPGIEYFLGRLSFNETLISLKYYFPFLLHDVPWGFGWKQSFEIYSDAAYFLLSRMGRTTLNDFEDEILQTVLIRFMRYPFFGLVCALAKVYLKSIFLNNVLSELTNLCGKGTHFFGYNLCKDFWESLSKKQKVEARHFAYQPCNLLYLSSDTSSDTSSDENQ